MVTKIPVHVSYIGDELRALEGKYDVPSERLNEAFTSAAGHLMEEDETFVHWTGRYALWLAAGRPKRVATA